MIEINELTKRYEDGVLALDHVTYKVEQGEIFCLLGANGAGKTTTINILLDFIQPTEGQASINGHDCTKFPLQSKKYVSYVSENVQLYGMFTARQNLAFFAELAGKTGLKKKDYDNVMRTVGLPEKALRMRLKNFSKGMRQKVGIIRAMLHNPAVLLLDEPTSAMDPHSSKLVRDAILELRDDKRAIIVCTHNLAEAELLADKIAIIRRGQIIAEDNSGNLKRPGKPIPFHAKLTLLSPSSPCPYDLPLDRDNR